MRFNILLAEDDDISQDIVRALLEAAGDIDLTIVTDGKAALEAALTTRFDLLILDQNLPHIPGDRVIRHLRAGNTRNSDTPILHFSAHFSAPAHHQPDGFNDMTLPKPLAAATFVATVRNLLERRSPPRCQTA